MKPIFAQIIHAAPSASRREPLLLPLRRQRGCFETRTDIPLIMSVGLHSGRTEIHMVRYRPIASALIHIAQTVLHSLWRESGTG